MKQGKNQPVWVVRAGIVTPKQLEDGCVDHLRVPGPFGFSVQSHAERSVPELAAGGRFPNASISVSTVVQIIAAAEAAGYTVNVVASPGRGYHATVEVPKPLPVNLAEALSATFTVERNPARSRPLAPGRQ